MRKDRIDRVGKIEKELKEIARRVDALTTQLHAADSKYGLHQLTELRERLDNLASRLCIDENEFRIFREVVSTLQRESYRKTSVKY